MSSDDGVRALAALDVDGIPAAAALSTDDLADRAAALVLSAESPNTIKTYRSAWASFVRFCTTYNKMPMPCDADTVVQYGTWLVERPKYDEVVGGEEHPRRMKFGPAGPRTVHVHLAAIAAVHRAAGYESPTDEAIVRRWLRGAKRAKGTAPKQKAPFLDEHYVAAIKALPDTTAGRRDGALLALGLVSALRRSNISALMIQDLGLDPQGFVVRVRRSKTDPFGDGDVVVIPYSYTATCPVLMIRRWLQVAGLENAAGEPDRELPEGTPVFLPVDRRDRIVRRRRADGLIAALTPDAIADIVQRHAKLLKLDPEKFGAHSLRAGFLTSSDAAGIPLDDTMDQSGHSSREVASRYIRHANPWNKGRARAARSLKT